MNANFIQLIVLYSMSYYLKGQIRSPFYLNIQFSQKNFYKKFIMNANIMKTQIFHKIKYELKCHTNHIWPLYLEVYFFFDIFFVQILILSKLFMNANILQTLLLSRKVTYAHFSLILSSSREQYEFKSHTRPM